MHFYEKISSVRKNVRERKSWSFCLLVLGRWKNLKMVVMFYWCCVRKEIKRLNECWSSEEHRKIFRAEPNHVSLCDGFGSGYSCVRFWLWALGNSNLNRNPFLLVTRESSFSFSLFFLLFCGGTLTAIQHRIRCMCWFHPSSKMESLAHAVNSSGNGKVSDWTVWSEKM